MSGWSSCPCGRWRTGMGAPAHGPAGVDERGPARPEDPGAVAPKLDPAKGLIDAMLTEDLSAPRKQRHTARRVLARLVDEHQLTDLT